MATFFSGMELQLSHLQHSHVKKYWNKVYGDPEQPTLEGVRLLISRERLNRGWVDIYCRCYSCRQHAMAGGWTLITSNSMILRFNALKMTSCQWKIAHVDLQLYHQNNALELYNLRNNRNVCFESRVTFILQESITISTTSITIRFLIVFRFRHNLNTIITD